MPNILYGPPGEQFNTTTAQKRPLGTLLVLQDGRWFRYGLNGGVAQTAGKVVQAEAPGGNFDDIAIPSAVAVGAVAISVTNGGTDITANMFNEGYMVVEDDAGEGHVYQMGAHAAIANTTAGTLNLAPGNSVQVAFTTATTVLLVKHGFKEYIIQPSPPTALPIGVTPTAQALTTYGWVQTKGPAAVLTDGTVVIGQKVVSSASVDGAVIAATDDLIATVGFVAEVAVTTEHSFIYLKMD